MSITKHSFSSGNIIGANGQIHNLVDLLGGGTPVNDWMYAISKYAPKSGLIIGNDGRLYDLTQLLSNFESKLPVPNYDYAGKNLKDIFGTAAAFRAAVAAGDFSRIRIGDYWPISLTGTYRDYAVDTDKTFNNAVLLMEVAGINIYWRYGDTALSAPHVLLCPRDCLPNAAQMRFENST